MLAIGDRVFHKKFGFGELLEIKLRPGTPMGDSAWVRWDTHRISVPVAGRGNDESNVNLTSLCAAESARKRRKE
jgi:hypothetical protein